MGPWHRASTDHKKTTNTRTRGPTEANVGDSMGAGGRQDDCIGHANHATPHRDALNPPNYCSVRTPVTDFKRTN